MISFRPKMFEESAESKAPKGFWLNFLIFLLVFLIGALLESIIPSILATRELVTTLMESDTFVNGSLEQRMQESMQLTTEVMLGNNTIMIFMEKSDEKDIYEIDWEMAQTELQNELEEQKKLEQMENEKKKQQA